MYGDALVVRMGVGGEALVEAAVARGRGALGWTRRHLWVGVDRVVEPNFASSKQTAVLGAPRELCVREGEVVKRWTECHIEVGWTWLQREVG